MNYSDFLSRKAAVDIPTGFEPRGITLNRPAFDFQRDVINWTVRRGRAAVFADCGLGKTMMQLAWASEVSVHGPVLILAPLAVGPQTVAEGAILGIDARQVSTQEEVEHFYKEGCRIFVTNYDKLHRFCPEYFAGVVLDESSILKAYDGATRKRITESFLRTKFKLACTATPAPNDFMELGNHAEFLGVMSREEMLSMFFTHDGGETSKWRLKRHAQSDFWRWLCSWAVNIRKPSDLGCEDGAFQLPPLHLHEHIVESEQQMDGYLFALPASTMQERRDARRASLPVRVMRAAELANGNDEQFIAWCNLNTESTALTRAINGAVEITGSDQEYHKLETVAGFLDGSIRCIVTKPSMFGHGLNFQHCRNEVFVGLNDSYEQYYQAVRRCWRFGQKQEVHAHIVISNIEGAVLSNLKRKEADAQRMAEQMVKHMAEISSKEIRGVKRDVADYKPKTKIKIPKWMAA